MTGTNDDMNTDAADSAAGATESDAADVKDAAAVSDSGAIKNSATPVRTTPRSGALSGKRAWIVGGIAALLLVAAAAALTVTGIRYNDARRGPNDTRDAVATGRLAAESMFGYDPKTVDKNVATARGLVVGDAAKQYSELVDQQNMVLIVKKNNVSSNLAIQGLGVEDSSKNSVKLLIFMNQSITRGDNQLVDIQASRLVFTIQRTGGQWKVADIEKISDNSVNKALQPEGQKPPNADPAIGGSAPESAAPGQPEQPAQPQPTEAPAPTAGP